MIFTETLVSLLVIALVSDSAQITASQVIFTCAEPYSEGGRLQLMRHELPTGLRRGTSPMVNCVRSTLSTKGCGWTARTGGRGSLVS